MHIDSSSADIDKVLSRNLKWLMGISSAEYISGIQNYPKPAPPSSHHPKLKDREESQNPPELPLGIFSQFNLADIWSSHYIR